MPNTNRSIYFAYLAAVISPIFFSTNVVFGRAATDIAPFTLAFIRWFSTGIILLLLSKSHWPAMWRTVKSQWKMLTLLGFLGMWICGAIVYLALRETTATNGTLIYTIPPVIIILIERFWRGRSLKLRESIGVGLAIIGVGIIVSRGSLSALLNLEFNPGDLLFLLAAVSWAIYSVVLKSEVLSGLGTLPLFCIVALFGALLLAPFALYEWTAGIDMPQTRHHWMIITGIIGLSSLIAFSTFQHGIRILGPSITSIFMYLLPVFGVGFAWYFLDEKIENFHFAGIATILGGVMLATFMTKRANKPIPHTQNVK